jgi:hypothetical protein
MSTLVIKGGTAEKRQLAREAIRWVMNNELYIRDSIRLNVSFKDLNEEYCGSAIFNGTNSFHSKSYSIVIGDHIDHNADKELFIETILHEMVHVWQMSNRIARYTLNNSKSAYKIFWNGEDKTHLPYSQQPWERQAYRMEKTLTAKFLAK